MCQIGVHPVTACQVIGLADGKIVHVYYSDQQYVFAIPVLTRQRHLPSDTLS